MVERSLSPPMPLSFYFLAGGVGDITACLFSHPIDTLKVRSQLKGEMSNVKQQQGVRTMFNDAIRITAEEGFLSSLYNGISASCLRQSTFSTLRHGGYATLCFACSVGNIDPQPIDRDGQRPPHPSANLPLGVKVACGTIAGGSAALLSNPTDVVLIRMQADNHWPKEQRRSYSNAVDGIRKIIRQEKLKSLWTGCTPNVLRATLITSTQIPSYYFAKEFFSDIFRLRKNEFTLHFISSLFSATVASVVTAPVDVVKTRLVNMKKRSGQQMKMQIGQDIMKHRALVEPHNSITYKGPLDCAIKTLRTEGIRGLYKGLVPTLARLTPHTVILWVVQENCLEKLWEFC